MNGTPSTANEPRCLCGNMVKRGQALCGSCLRAVDEETERESLEMVHWLSRD